MTNDKKRPNAADIVARLAAREKETASQLILAPVTTGAEIRVRVDGIVWDLKVEDRDFSGWALLRITAPGVAKVERAPTEKQIAEYLKLFPRIRMVLLESYDNRWWALPAQEKDPRFTIPGAVPVEMVRKTGTFDTFNCRFDGRRFYFEGPDRRREPQIARKLRQALEQDEDPFAVKVKGAVPAELRAYRMLWRLRHPEVTLVPPRPTPRSDEDRIKEALEHASADFDAFWLVDQEIMAVRFSVDSVMHTVNVTKNLEVVNSGICLSGQDQRFDLASLVGVFREHHRLEYDYD